MATKQAPPPAGGGRKIFPVLVPLLTIFVMLVGAEAVLRLFHPIPYAVEFNMYFEPDPFTGYKLKPHSVGHFHKGIVAAVNNQGHRDDDSELAPSPGVYRILVLGDSFTVGADVAQEEAYAQVLEVLLNRRLESAVEIVNTGVGGWDPFQYAQYYEHYGRYFSPDAVVIGFFVGNDTYSQIDDSSKTLTAVKGRRVRRQAAASPGIGIKIFLYEHSHLARWIMRHRTVSRALGKGAGRDHCQDFTPEFLDIQRHRLANHLKRSQRQEMRIQNALRQILSIKAATDREKIPLAVVLIPDENQINPHLRETLLAGKDANLYNFDMPQALLLEAFGSHGIPLVDLLPVFRSDPRCLYMNDTHWTAEGHELAAGAILKELAAAGIEPARRP